MYLKGEIMNLIAMSYQGLVYTCSHDPSFGTKVANGNLNRQTSRGHFTKQTSKGQLKGQAAQRRKTNSGSAEAVVSRR